MFVALLPLFSLYVCLVYSQGVSVSKTVVNGVEVPPGSVDFSQFFRNSNNNLFRSGSNNFVPFNSNFNGFNNGGSNSVNSVANAFSNGGSVSKTVVNGVEVPPGSVDFSQFGNFKFPGFGAVSDTEETAEAAVDSFANVFSNGGSVSKTVVNGVEVPPSSFNFGGFNNGGFNNGAFNGFNNFRGFDNFGSNGVNSVANAFSNGGSVSKTVVNGVEVPPGSVDFSQFGNFKFPGFGAVSDTEETAEAAVDSIARAFSNGGSVSKTVVNGVEVPPSSFNWGGFNNDFGQDFNNFGSSNFGSNGVSSVANAFSNGGSVSKTVVNGVEVPPGSVDFNDFFNFAQSEENEQSLESPQAASSSTASIPGWAVGLIVIGALVLVGLIVVIVQVFKLASKYGNI